MTTKQELESWLGLLENDQDTCLELIDNLADRIQKLELIHAQDIVDGNALEERVRILEAAGSAARGYAPEEPLDDFSLLEERQLRYVLRRVRDFLRADAASSWVNRGDVLRKIRDLVDGKS